MKGLVWGQIYFVLFASFAVLAFCERCAPDLAPQVAQGVLTLLASVLASGVALWIAYKAYPAQKQKDHELQMQAEMRSLAAQYFSEIAALKVFYCTCDDESKKPSKGLELQKKSFEKLAALVFYVPGDVADLISKPLKFIAAEEYKRIAPAERLREFRDRETEAIISMRGFINSPRKIKNTVNDANYVMRALDRGYGAQK